MFEKIGQFVKTYSLQIFIFFILLGICLHCTTLSYSPLPWMDEVQINEIVRGGIGEKETSWTMALVRGDGQLDTQAWALYYLGGLSSEFGYILFGQAGNRILNLLWLLVSTGLLTIYVYKKTRHKLLTCLVGLLYFTFPPLCQSVRGGRVDVLAFLFLFASLSLLQLNAKSKKDLLFKCMASAVCAACAVFSWITAILCMPIVLWEALEAFKKRGLSLKQQLTTLIMMAVAGVVTGVVVLTPFLIRYQLTIDTFMLVLAINSSVSSGAPYFREIIKALCAIPGLYLFGLSLLFARRRFVLLVIATIVICAIAVMTHCYIFRIVYLLPYALIGTAITYGYIHNSKLKITYLAILLFMAVVSYSYSILLRNGTEFFAKNVRDAEVSKQVLEKEIGKNAKIYCDTFQLYYIGRELNWKQYRLASKLPAEGEVLDGFEIEYYITEKEKLAPRISEVLKEKGFVFTKKIAPFEFKNLSQVEKLLQKVGRLTSYGPYYLYSKSKMLNETNSLNE